MIPSILQRGPQPRRNVPVWMIAAGAVVLAILLFFIWVLATMGSAPTLQEVTSEVTVQQ